MIITGVDKINENWSLLKKKKIALITGSSNVNSYGESVFIKIKELAGINLKSIWSLQHGFFIDKQDNMISNTLKCITYCRVKRKRIS